MQGPQDTIRIMQRARRSFNASTMSNLHSSQMWNLRTSSCRRAQHCQSMKIDRVKWPFVKTSSRRRRSLSHLPHLVLCILLRCSQQPRRARKHSLPVDLETQRVASKNHCGPSRARHHLLMIRTMCASKSSNRSQRRPQERAKLLKPGAMTQNRQLHSITKQQPKVKW